MSIIDRNRVSVDVIAAIGSCIKELTEISPLGGVPSGHPHLAVKVEEFK